jgi:hypothetical protein
MEDANPRAAIKFKSAATQGDIVESYNYLGAG